MTSQALPRIAIIAALPGELKPLVRGWNASVEEGIIVHRKHFESFNCIAIAGGIGRESAARACTRAFADGKLAAIVSTGWAGALSCGMKPGHAFAVNEVVDASTGERYQTAAPLAGSTPIRLVTTKRIATKQEKRQLLESYSAFLVDMEAATVGRLARLHDIPFYCFKAVSDEANESLPDMNPYLTGGGQMRMAPFVSSVAFRPRYWPALVRMGRNSSRGAIVLAEAIHNFLDAPANHPNLNELKDANSQQPA